MIPGSTNQLLAAGVGYQISRSVRLRSSATAYFNRTLTTPTSQNIWSFSCWVKRGSLAKSQFLFWAGTLSTNDCALYFSSSDQIGWFTNNGSSVLSTSTAVFRDPSAWYHIVAIANSTTMNVYVNNQQVITNAGMTNNTINSAIVHNIGRDGQTAGNEFDGYLTEINFIDGQALTPASFGVTNAYGVWSPIKYNGTYGTNGFYLNFSDNSGATATTIGKDYSGNGNNWTPNNISVTSGSTYDSMLDVPTQWADGGNGRGNYCVLNPLDKDANITFSNGNLTATGYNAGGAASFGLTSSKWYWEVTLVNDYASNNWGIHGVSSGKPNSYISGYTGYATGAGVWANTGGGSGGTWAGGSLVSGSTTWANGDVIGFAFDATNLTLDVYRNNVKIGTTLTVPSGAIYPSVYQNGTSGDTSATAYNFGQRPFAYTPPTGFKALNTLNLPTPTIANGANYFAATLYTGTGASRSVDNTVNNVSFQPDFVWVKGRSGATDHALYDAVRGVQLQLESNTTTAETTETTGLTAFNSNGFTVGALAQMNTNTATYVAWQWKEGATQGFDIVTFTATGNGQTINHSLGVAPKMIIYKPRNAAIGWTVMHDSLANMTNRTLELNTTSAVLTIANAVSAPTSTTFGCSASVANNTNTMVAYLFAEVAGFSRFGSYTGNGSADGPFVFCGFRPRYILIKISSAATDGWTIQDTARAPNNVVTDILAANSSASEATLGFSFNVDILSNGFKIRNTTSAQNTNGATYIFAAFAEVPFRNALAR